MDTYIVSYVVIRHFCLGNFGDSASGLPRYVDMCHTCNLFPFCGCFGVKCGKGNLEILSHLSLQYSTSMIL